MSLSLAVCILFHEKVDQTIECVRSFVPSGVPVYILNNASSAPAREQLGEFCANYPQVAIFDAPRNLGVGPGRNFLITNTTEAWLLFVDNDITVRTPDWLDKIRDHIEQEERFEVFVPRLYNVHENSYVSYRPMEIAGRKAFLSATPSDFLNNFPGGASFVSRKLFDRLGLYDDEIFVGGEDFEFAIRGALSGEPVRARCIDDIEMVHDHRQAVGESDKAAVLERYSAEKIGKSYQRIREKHGIVLRDGWEKWVAEQVRKITGQQTLRDRILAFIRRCSETVMAFGRQEGLPRTCTLFMTERCNLKCAGCSRSLLGAGSAGDMRLATVKRLLELYPKTGSFCVAGLGEPTLCPDFAAIVEFLKEQGKFVGVITNGANPDPLFRLAGKPDYVSISLYGYDEESYGNYCGVRAFATVLDTFGRLRECFPQVGFSYIVNRDNYRDLEKVLQLCDRLRPDFLHLVNYLVYDPADATEIGKIITARDTEIIAAIEAACKGRGYIRTKPVYPDLEHPRCSCMSYRQLINLDGDGNIGGCQRQIRPAARFGNIFSDPDPFNSPEIRRLRERVGKECGIHEECRYCFGNWA